MPIIIDMMAMTQNPYSLENLMQAAFNRFKDRFLSYFLAGLLGFGLFLGFFIVAGLVGAAFIIPLVLLKNTTLVVIVSIILGVAAFIGFVYLEALIVLLTVQVVIQEEKKGVMETLRDIRPKVKGYVWYVVISSLFFIGLLPFGIFSLFIITLLWGLWNTFSTFVYLQYQKKGLDNLWVSQAIYNTDFWGVTGRIVLLQVVLTVLGFVLAWVTQKNTALSTSVNMLSFVTAPFVLAYSYEIYKNLKKPTDVNHQTVWMVLSIIGFVLITLISIGVASYLITQPGIYDQIPTSNSLPTYPSPSSPMQ